MIAKEHYTKFKLLYMYSEYSIKCIGYFLLFCYLRKERFLLIMVSESSVWSHGSGGMLQRVAVYMLEAQETEKSTK